MSVRLLEAEASADPPPGIVLRAFRRDDLEPLVDANNAIFAEHWGSAPRTVDSWRRDMIERRPHDPALWIVASTPEREGASQLVAECLSHASREGGPEDAWVSLVGVRREWRGRGLGRAVLAHGLRTLRDAGYATASLHVDAENTSAVNLYRSLGMDVTRTRLHFEKIVRG
jgi:ribosomal protein S18 acetylase RimI-like enzyme